MAYLTDGYQTLIQFILDPAVKFKEREVQPPNIDGGGEIDTTTMRNTRWRTKQPKSLVTLGDSTIQVQYDPVVYDNIVENLLNKNGIINIFFPDGQILTFFGWIDSFTPSSHREGEFATAEMKIHCSNQDNDGNEVPPAMS